MHYRIDVKHYEDIFRNKRIEECLGQKSKTTKLMTWIGKKIHTSCNHNIIAVGGESAGPYKTIRDKYQHTQRAENRQQSNQK